MKIECLQCHQKNESEVRKKVCPSCKSRFIKIISTNDDEKKILEKEERTRSLQMMTMGGFASIVLLSIILFEKDLPLLGSAILSILFIIFTIITVGGYDGYFKKKSISLKKLLLIIGLLLVLSFSFRGFTNISKFEIEITKGNYQIESNNSIQTRVKSFDLNLSIKGLKSLKIDDKTVLIQKLISYPINIEDDSTIKISGLGDDEKNHNIEIKIDYLTNAEFEAKKIAEERLKEKNDWYDEWSRVDDITAYVVSKVFVKSRLKSPSSAKFPSGGKYDYENLKEGYWLITSYVDSQNSFGATIRTRYKTKLKYMGGDKSSIKNWILIDMITE